MKQTILLTTVFVLSLYANAQKAIVEVFIPSQIKVNSAILSPAHTKDEYLYEYSEDGWELEAPVVKGKALLEMDLPAPQSMVLYVDELTPAVLFLSPGDHLVLHYQEKNGRKSYTVTGKGSNNNQVNLARPYFSYYEKYAKDTLPHRLLKDLRNRYREDSVLLRSYIDLHKPSPAYIAAQEAQLRYFVPQVYYSFFGSHGFTLKNMPGKEKLVLVWQQALDSIMATVPLNNDEALISSNYAMLVTTFLSRKKEAIWESLPPVDSKARKEWWYDEPDSGKALMEDMENLLTAKIIKRYFTGKTAEFAYTHMLHEAIGEKEDNLLSIYDTFVQQYPNSPYQPYLAPRLEPVRQRFTRPLTDKMIILPDSPSLNSFAEIRSIMKGKTVLLDLWGTWCGPCRKEINENSQALKDHFKGKDVTFLYIANFDTNSAAKWKSLIPYYNLEGTHILAGPALTHDIAKAVNLKSYPTYVIIKKDGSFELSTAGYPMDRDKLIKQIEAAL